MINTLIIYSTTDGQTLSICNVIIENNFNDDVKICSINESEFITFNFNSSPLPLRNELICNPFSFAGPHPKQIEVGAY